MYRTLELNDLIYRRQFTRQTIIHRLLRNFHNMKNENSNYMGRWELKCDEDPSVIL